MIPNHDTTANTFSICVYLCRLRTETQPRRITLRGPGTQLGLDCEQESDDWPEVHLYPFISKLRVAVEASNLLSILSTCSKPPLVGASPE